MGGYESRFYVVEKSSFIKPEPGNMVFSSIIACFSMSKMGYRSKTMKLVEISLPTNCYIYADDGNTQIIKDRYDDKLKDVDMGALIKCLKADDDGYRRIKPFIAFLESLDLSKWDQIKILHFGY